MGVIAQAPRLDGRSRVIAYDTELQMRANIIDIYTMKTGEYNRENESFPDDAIQMSIKDQSVSESIITLKENLQLAGVYGQTPARGTEEPPRTLMMRTFQDNYRKVIPYPGYGLQKLEADKYKLYEKHKNGMGLWNDEQHGVEIRQSHLERYGVNMFNATSNVFASLTGNQAQTWNPNMWIPGQSYFNQPAFSLNRATHTNNICNGLLATGGFGQFRRRTLSPRVLEDVSNMCVASRLKSIRIPGLPTGKGFVCTISELQASFLSLYDPVAAQRNLGAAYVAKAALSDTVQKWRGVIGGYMNLLLVVDQRQPTLIPTGTAAPFGLQAGYMWWDSADLRNRDNANVKDTMFVHGASNLIKVEGEKLHWISDTQDYDFDKGVGTAGVRGRQIPIFVAEDGSVVYDRGAVVILDLPNQGTMTENS